MKMVILKFLNEILKPTAYAVMFIITPIGLVNTFGWTSVELISFYYVLLIGIGTSFTLAFLAGRVGYYLLKVEEKENEKNSDLY